MGQQKTWNDAQEHYDNHIALVKKETIYEKNVKKVNFKKMKNIDDEIKQMYAIPEENHANVIDQILKTNSHSHPLTEITSEVESDSYRNI